MAKSNDHFYLGRLFDPKKAEITSDPLMYDPDDLTTHAVAVGMTGSGKTGLCIDLLEEAALQGIPPYKKDILVELFGVGWFPYYSFEDQGKEVELAAFSKK